MRGRNNVSSKTGQSKPPLSPFAAGSISRKPSFFANVSCEIGCRGLPGPCQECIVLSKDNAKTRRPRRRKRSRKPSFYANVTTCTIGCRDLPEPCCECAARQKRRLALKYWGYHKKQVRETKAAEALLLLAPGNSFTFLCGPRGRWDGSPRSAGGSEYL